MRPAAWRERIGARWRASPRLQDVVTAAATFGLGLGLNLLGLFGVWPFAGNTAPAPAWWHTALLAIGCAAMLVKRRHPVAALGVGAAAVAADLAIGGSVGMVLV